MVRRGGALLSDPVVLWETAAAGVDCPLATGNQIQFTNVNTIFNHTTPGGSFFGATHPEIVHTIDVSGYHRLMIEAHLKIATGDAGITGVTSNKLRAMAAGVGHWTSSDPAMPYWLTQDSLDAAVDNQLQSIGLMVAVRSPGSIAITTSHTWNNGGTDTANPAVVPNLAATPTVGHTTHWRLYVGQIGFNAASTASIDNLHVAGLSKVYLVLRANTDGVTGSGTIKLAGRIVAHRLYNSIWAL